MLFVFYLPLTTKRFLPSFLLPDATLYMNYSTACLHAGPKNFIHLKKNGWLGSFILSIILIACLFYLGLLYFNALQPTAKPQPLARTANSWITPTAGPVQ